MTPEHLWPILTTVAALGLLWVTERVKWASAGIARGFATFDPRAGLVINPVGRLMLIAERVAHG
jgi:hypothetical protein